MKLALNQESASALRTFAEAMPFAIENIRQDTEKIIQVYQSVADSLGVHEQNFYDMLMIIKNAQEIAAEAIQILPPKMVLVADKIDAYVAAHPSVSASGGN